MAGEEEFFLGFGTNFGELVTRIEQGCSTLEARFQQLDQAGTGGGAFERMAREQQQLAEGMLSRIREISEAYARIGRGSEAQGSRPTFATALQQELRAAQTESVNLTRTLGAGLGPELLAPLGRGFSEVFTSVGRDLQSQLRTAINGASEDLRRLSGSVSQFQPARATTGIAQQLAALERPAAGAASPVPARAAAPVAPSAVTADSGAAGDAAAFAAIRERLTAIRQGLDQMASAAAGSRAGARGGEVTAEQIMAEFRDRLAARLRDTTDPMRQISSRYAVAPNPTDPTRNQFFYASGAQTGRQVTEPLDVYRANQALRALADATERAVAAEQARNARAVEVSRNPIGPNQLTPAQIEANNRAVEVSRNPIGPAVESPAERDRRLSAEATAAREAQNAANLIRLQGLNGQMVTRDVGGQPMQVSAVSRVGDRLVDASGATERVFSLAGEEVQQATRAYDTAVQQFSRALERSDAEQQQAAQEAARAAELLRLQGLRAQTVTRQVSGQDVQVPAVSRVGDRLVDASARIERVFDASGAEIQQGTRAYDSAIAAWRRALETSAAELERASQQAANAANLSRLQAAMAAGGDVARNIRGHDITMPAVGQLSSNTIMDNRGMDPRFFDIAGQELVRGTQRYNAAIERWNRELERAASEVSSGGRGGGGIGDNFMRGMMSGGFGGGPGGLEGLSRSAGTTVKYTALYSVLGMLQQAASQAAAEMLNFDDSQTELAVTLGQSSDAIQGQINDLERYSIVAGANVGDIMDVAARGARAFADTAILNDEAKRGTQEYTDALAKARDVGSAYASEASRMAVIANTDLKDAAGNISAIGTSFDVPATGFARINDAISLAKSMGGGDAKDTAQGLASVGAAAQQAGFSLEQTAVLVGRVQARTDTTGQAVGTKLSRIISIASGSAGQDMLSKLVPAAQGKSAADQLMALSDAWDGLSEAQKKAATNTFGGTASPREFLASMASLQKLAGQPLDSAGKSTEEYQRRLQDLTHQLAALRGEASALAVNLGRSGMLAPIEAMLLLLKGVLVPINAILSAWDAWGGKVGAAMRETIGGLAAVLIAMKAIASVQAAGGIAAMMRNGEQVIAPGRAFARQQLNPVGGAATGAGAAAAGGTAAAQGELTAATRGQARATYAETERRAAAAARMAAAEAEATAATTELAAANQRAAASSALGSWFPGSTTGNAAAAAGAQTAAQARMVAAQTELAAATQSQATLAAAQGGALTGSAERVVLAETDLAAAQAARAEAAGGLLIQQTMAAERVIAAEAELAVATAEEAAARGAVATASFDSLLVGGAGARAGAGAAAHAAEGGVGAATRAGTLGGAGAAMLTSPWTWGIAGLIALGQIKSHADDLAKAMDQGGKDLEALRGAQTASDYRNSASGLAATASAARESGSGVFGLLQRHQGMQESATLTHQSDFATYVAKQIEAQDKLATGMQKVTVFGDPAATTAESVSAAMKSLTDSGMSAQEQIDLLTAAFTTMGGAAATAAPIDRAAVAGSTTTGLMNPATSGDLSKYVSASAQGGPKNFAEQAIGTYLNPGGSRSTGDEALAYYRGLVSQKSQQIEDAIQKALPALATGPGGTLTGGQKDDVTNKVMEVMRPDLERLAKNFHLDPRKLDELERKMIQDSLSGKKGTALAPGETLSGEQIFANVAEDIKGMQAAVSMLLPGDVQGKITLMRQSIAFIDTQISHAAPGANLGAVLAQKAQMEAQIATTVIADLEDQRRALQNGAKSKAQIKAIGEKFMKQEAVAAALSGNTEALINIINNANRFEIAMMQQAINDALAVAAAARAAEAAKAAAVSGNGLYDERAGRALGNASDEAAAKANKALGDAKSRATPFAKKDEGLYASGSDSKNPLADTTSGPTAEQIAAARNAANAARVGGALATTAAAIRTATADMHAAKKGTVEYYNALGQLYQAQESYREALRAYQKIRWQLAVDMTDPVKQAYTEIWSAQRKLADDRKRGAGKDVLAQDTLDLRNSQNQAESAQFSQRLSDAQTAEQLGRMSHSAYISYLQNEHNRLNSIKTKSRQQIDQLNQIDLALKSASETMQGQFNIGDIKIPSIYEVRRYVKAQAAGVGYQGGNSSTVNIQIDGTDTGMVKKVLSQYLGPAQVSTRVTTATRKVG